MRVVFSGSHRTGKTTLVEAISSVLPAYDVIDEPYRLLEDEGYEFADPPTVDDFERQLRRSIETITNASTNVLLDRCPLDFIAYLGDDFDRDAWLDDIRDAIARLDLIVVVPIEGHVRHEDDRLRRAVDERIRALALDDSYGFEAETLEVSGGLDERVRQVLRAMRIS